jgi:hypothetical protein
MGTGLLAVKSGFILFNNNYQFPLQINTLEREKEREAAFGQSVGNPKSDLKHFTWCSHLRNATLGRGGGEGLRLQIQGDQDLCAAAAGGHLMFKTSTEDQTVHLRNKGMTKDSPRFSPWFHSAWRTTGPIL